MGVMKKVLSIVLLFTLVFTTACSDTAQDDASTGQTGESNEAVESTDAADADDSTDEADEASEEPVKITFYTYNYTNEQKDGVDKMIADFNGIYPNIEIEVVFVQSTEIHTKIQADLAAGITPDIVQVVFDALDFAVNNYGIQDLNNLVDKAELEEHLAGFEPAALEVPKVDDKLVGLPYVFSTPVLFYNVALFEEAGLDPDAPPTTWEEVEEYALQIKEKTEKDGFANGAYIGNDWLLQSIIKSNGGSIMSEDKSTIEFGGAEGVEAMTAMSGLTKSGAQMASADPTQGIEAFTKGELGMLLYTSALQASMLDAANASGWEMRTAKMPAFGDKPTVPVNSGSGLFICSTDKAKQDAAWKFIKYVTSDEGYTVITSMMGYPPLRPAIMDDERYLKTWAMENPLAGPNLEQLSYVTPWESFPGNNWYQIETLFLEAATKCVYSDVDIEKTMKDAQEQAQSLMP